MGRYWIFSILLLLPFSEFLQARDFWDKDFREWKQNEAMRILTRSPWAGQHAITRQLMAGRFESGAGGEREAHDTYTVRFFSALPVREAYVRLMQLNRDYDRLSPEQRQQFDAQTEPFLTAAKGDIVLALEFSSNDRSMTLEVMRQLNLLQAPQLQGNVYLSTDSAGMVPLKEYFPPGEDGTGARFIFPRTVDGEPVIKPEDQEVRFRFDWAEMGHNVFIRWRVRDMAYRDELEY